MELNTLKLQSIKKRNSRSAKLALLQNFGYVSACAVLQMCQCGGWVKLFFKCAVGKFLNPSGRLEYWQGKVGLCQVTAKLSAVFGCPFFGCVGRPTLAGNTYIYVYYPNTNLINYLILNFKNFVFLFAAEILCSTKVQLIQGAFYLCYLGPAYMGVAHRGLNGMMSQ